MLSKRVISAIVALPLLFFLVLYNEIVFFGAVCVVTIIGLNEYFSAISSTKTRPMKSAGYIMAILLLFLIYNNAALNFIIPFITLTMLMLLSIPIFSQKYNLWGAGATIIGVLYVPLFFGYLYLIRSIPDKGIYFIWFVFICSWITDTGAYFSGMAFGKRKLCPSVSPKKTIEGSIGGIIGSIVGCLFYGYLLNRLNVGQIPITKLVFLGFLGSIISQIGDLAASSIKRNVGIKDFGKIMPGHGGVLDRFDSILFVAPLIYYYIIYII